MQKIFHGNNAKISRKQNCKLYKLFNSVKSTPDVIHNLSNVRLPIEYKALLTLGLKYCIPFYPNYKTLEKALAESIRKISWRVHLQSENVQNNALSIYDKWKIECKKHLTVIDKLKHAHSDKEKEIFPNENLYSDFSKKLKYNTTHVEFISKELIKSFNIFCIQNNLKIQAADKNAGICVLDKTLYDKEVFNQLNDESTYFPSTDTHYTRSIDVFIDKVKCWEKTIDIDGKISYFIPVHCKPAKFYILPKIHKAFIDFPKGRPISSTMKTYNRPISKLLDKFLQPIMLFVPDLLLDTTHLLLLLNNVKLDPNIKYTLVTVDIVALYTNLPTKVCKEHCCKNYSQFKNLVTIPFNMETSQLKTLLDLSLDFNYVQYEEHYYTQFKGIQMGGASSCSIANITVYEEIKNMFENANEIIFHKRFLDDILMIVNSTDIDNMDCWLEQKFKHKFLSFTYTHNNNAIDFLDVHITLNEKNELGTSLYKKPMNKQQYLHYMSNHPNHLKNSLPFSQGLRIIRTCSVEAEREAELCIMIQNFKKRCYPNTILDLTMQKLNCIQRETLLVPRKILLTNVLRIHNPEILSLYNINENIVLSPHIGKSFVIMPFYRSIHSLKNIVHDTIVNEYNKCKNDDLRSIANNIILQIAYSKVDCISSLLAK